MSGHEFEKQVRQKLNDLKLSPTSKVWENIEENLRERRRRPAVIYWLPLLLIGLVAGGYLLFNEGVGDRQLVVGSPELAVGSRETANGKRETVGSRELAVGSRQSEMSSRTEAIASREGSGIKANQLPVSSRQLELYKKASRDNEKISAVPDPSREAIGMTGEDTPDGNHETVGSRQSAVSSHETANSNRETASSDVIPNRGEAPREGSGEKTSRKAVNDKPQKTELSPKTKKSNKSKPWSYGISATAGVSAVNEGKLLGFNNAQVEDVSIVAPFAPSPTYKPSTISPGFTYSAGVFAKRDLSKKFSLSLGLNYLQLNTRNKVGYQMSGRAVVNNGNSGYLFVSNYFTIDQDNTAEYRNRYHFIELPIELHTSINHSKKLPINITTGIAVSRLLKSNSLHFDGTTGVYYQNDKLLKRTQVAAKAGLTFGVLNKTKRPLWIGPSMNYNISKILKKDVSTRKNFMSFGVDAKMFLRR